MSIEIRGLDKVIDSLGKTFSDEEIESLLQTACLYVERSAKYRAPKGDGDLRRSITSKVEGNEGIVFTPLEYAPYVEYGTGLFAENGDGRKDVPWFYKDDEGKGHLTSGQNPQPFLRPALEARRCDIIRLFKEAITNK